MNWFLDLAMVLVLFLGFLAGLFTLAPKRCPSCSRNIVGVSWLRVILEPFGQTSITCPICGVKLRASISPFLLLGCSAVFAALTMSVVLRTIATTHIFTAVTGSVIALVGRFSQTVEILGDDPLHDTRDDLI